ncbi:hypothetical protein H5410_035322 [Solanum commersonii]|uniref:Knottins-like domain-containing protein n=1 Tax=Solanum commersonii TaxID=4109 RepID=A0A9J5Y2C7_SOLCO|nr:hypothetical protein H5410_035322 [Solanum commersonii]
MEQLFKVMFLLVLFSIGNAEAKDCVEWSKTFKGPCSSVQKCRDACISEGFTDGYCAFLRRYRRCSCSKPCLFNNYLP